MSASMFWAFPDPFKREHPSRGFIAAPAMGTVVNEFIDTIIREEEEILADFKHWGILSDIS